MEFLRTLRAQVFTVVIDKHTYGAKHPTETPDPYHYALQVILSRIRGYLHLNGAQADVFAESRGRREDARLRAEYRYIRTHYGPYLTPEQYRAAFPDEELMIRRKEHNVLGLQIADLLVSDQKIDIAIRNGKPTAKTPSDLAQRLTAAAAHMINDYGRVLLD